MTSTAHALAAAARSLAGTAYRGPSIEGLHALATQRRVDEKAPIQASAEVAVAAPREEVWRVLADLAAWPSYGIGVSAMSVPDGVAVDRVFRWTTGGVPLTSRLAVVEPNTEISWTGWGFGVRAIHRVTLHAVGPAGTVLRSEESMSAPGLALLYPSATLARDLTAFLEGLRRAVEGGDRRSTRAAGPVREAL